MKKTSFYFLRYALTIVSCTQYVCTFDSVEALQQTIAENLQKTAPDTLGEFQTHCQQYHELVHNFFATDNHESLSTHIHKMRNKLTTLEHVCKDRRYHSVHHLLDAQRKQVHELVTILESYKGSTNSIGLAWEVKRFKPLLPSHLRTQTNYTLWRALHHRLGCR